MAKQLGYAMRFANEKTPSVAGEQYRASEVKKIDERCTGCAAAIDGVINKDLCNALPPCGKERRLDGMNVVYVHCGKAVTK